MPEPNAYVTTTCKFAKPHLHLPKENNISREAYLLPLICTLPKDSTLFQQHLVSVGDRVHQFMEIVSRLGREQKGVEHTLQVHWFRSSALRKTRENPEHTGLCFNARTGDIMGERTGKGLERQSLKLGWWPRTPQACSSFAARAQQIQV